MRSASALAYREYISIHLETPRFTIDDNSSEPFITYEIALKTNSLSFAAPHTRVHRRYRDFVWLHRRLKNIPNHIIPVPSLPRKQLPFWNFDSTFLEKRRRYLELFLKKVVCETIFLSSSSLHLFLQTALSPFEMESFIENGNADMALEKHVNLAKVDDDLTDSFQSSIQVTPETLLRPHDNDSGVKPDRRDSNIFWQCERSTMQRVASLPHFSPVLKDFDAYMTNNGLSDETVKYNNNEIEVIVTESK